MPAILKEPPLRIELGGLRTELLRVECDREHPVWPNHGECNGSPYSVPFGILNGLAAIGRETSPLKPEFSYLPGLRQGSLAPAAPTGMEVRQTPLGIFFSSRASASVFRLKRPLLVHLGWDVLGKGQAEHNRLKADWAIGIGTQVGGLSGPFLRTDRQDFGAQHWTGEVSVLGNRVEYRDLQVVGRD